MDMAERKKSNPSPPVGFILNTQGNISGLPVDVIHDNGITAAISVNIHQQTLIINVEDKVLDIMSVAVNNRTRERNYFKLYSQLLENKISDEEFDRLIDENPDEYVQEPYRHFGPLELEIARRASENIMDVDDVSDMATLFSISNESIQKCIAANE